MNTTTIPATSCDNAVHVALTGANAQTKVLYNTSSDPSVVTGYGPGTGTYIWAYPVLTPTAGIDFKVCNSSGTATGTRGALSINWIAYP